MIEREVNLWEVEADAVVITTNGYVKANGEAVMGRGCAKEAAERWSWLPRELGSRLTKGGNHVYVWRPGEGSNVESFHIVTFPVKHHWQEAADRDLIECSARELLLFVRVHEDTDPFKTVVMPRPGCGNGQLCWERCGDTCLGEPVKGLLEGILDDRFIVVTYPEVVF